MSGYAVPDPVVPIAAVTGLPNRTEKARPAATINAVLLSATENAAILVNVLRVVNTSPSAAATYSLYRIATGGAATAEFAISANVPIGVGETHFHENIVLEAGEDLVVVSSTGDVTFSADYAGPSA